MKYSIGVGFGALLLAGQAAAQTKFEINLTSEGLGLGSSNINYGSRANADVAGKLITSPTTGTGSQLFVQQNGFAGMADLLMTVTAETRLLKPSSVGNDWNAGVLTLTGSNFADAFPAWGFALSILTRMESANPT